MEKRTPQEKEKYQPSYDTTILSEARIFKECTVGLFVFLHNKMTVILDFTVAPIGVEWMQLRIKKSVRLLIVGKAYS